jgi:hypothetical protein
MEKNVFEFSEEFAPQDKQIFIDNMVSSLLGKPEEPVIVRKTLKLSSVGTEEEILQAIADGFGISIEQVKKMNVMSGLNAINADHEKINTRISSFRQFLLDQNATKDKFDELWDLGKFLFSYSPEYDIYIPEKLMSYPDFIVTKETNRIGIEHTRLMDNKSKNLISTIKNILKKAEKILLSKDPSLTQIINVSINYSKLILNNKSILLDRFDAKEKNEIAAVISEYLASLLNNELWAKPEFIENAQIVKGSSFPVSVELNEKYLGKSDFTELLLKTIEAKEKKFSNYSAVENINELWLLVVAGGASTASSYVFTESLFENAVNSQFDKILLFDNFSHQVKEVPSVKHQLS